MLFMKFATSFSLAWLQTELTILLASVILKTLKMKNGNINCSTAFWHPIHSINNVQGDGVTPWLGNYFGKHINVQRAGVTPLVAQFIFKQGGFFYLLGCHCNLY